MNEKSEAENSPNGESQQIVSDDDEIDYSTKPEFYDPKFDEINESWAQKQRRGRTSDAVLSCPACFTTLSLDCQRIKEEVPKPGSRRKRDGRNSQAGTDPTGAAETFKRVCCSVCSTDVGVVDEDEVYHFLNVIPSEA